MEVEVGRSAQSIQHMEVEVVEWTVVTVIIEITVIIDIQPIAWYNQD